MLLELAAPLQAQAPWQRLMIALQKLTRLLDFDVIDEEELQHEEWVHKEHACDADHLSEISWRDSSATGCSSPNSDASSDGMNRRAWLDSFEDGSLADPRSCWQQLRRCRLRPLRRWRLRHR